MTEEKDKGDEVASEAEKMIPQRPQCNNARNTFNRGRRKGYNSPKNK